MKLEEVRETSVNIENITKKDGVYIFMVGVDKNFPPPLIRHFKLNEKYLIGNKLEKLAPYTQIIVKSKERLSLNKDVEILQVLLKDKTLIYDASKFEDERKEQEKQDLLKIIKNTDKQFSLP